MATYAAISSAIDPTIFDTAIPNTCMIYVHHSDALILPILYEYIALVGLFMIEPPLLQRRTHAQQRGTLTWYWRLPPDETISASHCQKTQI